MRTNVIVRSQTVFYAENYTRLSDFFEKGVRGGGGVLQPHKLTSEKQALWRKPLQYSWCESTHTKNTPCSLLEVYEKTPIFIPVDIIEDVIKLVAHKLSRVQALEVKTQKPYRGGF